MAKMLTKNILAGMNRYYAFALEHLAILMKETGVDHLCIRYPDCAGRCFNINTLSGNAEMIVELRLTPEDGLVAIGDGETEYPLGKDIDGQDNYLLINFSCLLEQADREVERLQSSCIQIKSKSKAELSKQVSDFVNDKTFVFSEDNRPVVSGETVTAINGGCIVTKVTSTPNNSWRHPLGTLQVKELIDIIRHINNETIRKNNK